MRLTDISQISTIPENETDIDLSYNCLNRLGAIELAQAMQKIPSWITNLNLSKNNLGQIWGCIRAEGIIVVLEAIPKTVTSLNLSGNGFDIISFSDLVQIFPAIPEVTSLNLSFNGFGRLKGEERKELIEFLLDTGKNIILGYPLSTELQEARSSKLEMYGTLFYESKTDLPDGLVNEIFELSYPKAT